MQIGLGCAGVRVRIFLFHFSLSFSLRQQNDSHKSFARLIIGFSLGSGYAITHSWFSFHALHLLAN